MFSYLSGLVLGDLVVGVLLAVLALAVGAASLWYVHLQATLISIACTEESKMPVIAIVIPRCVAPA